jgi:dipeptidyl aminopeptidase/acylaminoacyl peptidase
MNRAARCLLGVLFLTMTTASASPPSAEIYGRLPAIFDVAISPDGTRIVVGRDGADGANRVLVLDTDRGTVISSVQRRDYKHSDKRDRIHAVRWADQHRIGYLLEATTPTGPVSAIDVFDLFRMTLLDTRFHTNYMVHQGGVNDDFLQLSQILAPIAGDAESGRAVLPARDNVGSSSVYRIDLRDGRTRLLQKGSVRTERFAFNQAGDPVARLDVTRHKNLWEIRDIRNGRDNVIATGSEDLGQLGFAGALANGDIAVVGRPSNEDNVLLYGINPDTGATSIVLEDPDEDVHQPIADPWLHIIVGVSWGGDIHSESYLDSQLAAIYQQLKAMVPSASIHLHTWTADRSRIVVYIETARDAGGYYLFDVAKSQLSLIGMLHPDIKGTAALGDRQVITYPARDGRRVSAVLTLPAAEPAGLLPLVILSDGDARDRADLGYSWLASFLATQGYAVVEPNERGTHGYGHAWKTEGDGQWAHRMNDDIHDAVTSLVKAGRIDKDRVCVIGMGDGGYSALLGAATSPDRYRCAVSVNGVADLAKYIEYLKLRTWTYSTFRRWYTKLLGNDATSNKALKAISPAHLAEAVQADVLLIHDASDTLSPLSQSESMAAALKRAGKRVRLKVLPGEDHYLEEPENRIEVLQALETFLQQHLRPESTSN